MTEWLTTGDPLDDGTYPAYRRLVIGILVRTIRDAANKNIPKGHKHEAREMITAAWPGNWPTIGTYHWIRC